MKLLPILFEIYKKVGDLRDFLSPKKEKVANS